MRTIAFAKDAGQPVLADWLAPAEWWAITRRDREAADAVKRHVAQHGLEVDGLDVSVDLARGAITVHGAVADQTTADKIVACCGNLQGIAQVCDDLSVSWAAASVRWHTVVPGESLQKIAQTYYGHVSAYQTIFAANYPMLDDPKHLYTGQVLMIPA